jgi:hypothetical protein
LWALSCHAPLPNPVSKETPPLHACPRLGKLIVSADVAFRSKSDIGLVAADVRFTLQSGHR